MSHELIMSHEYRNAEEVDEFTRGDYTGGWVSRKHGRTLVEEGEDGWIIASSKNTTLSSKSPVSDDSSDKKETGSSSEKTTDSSSSPVSDGSGGGKDAGSSGNETTPPSVSPVSDGSGGGKEVAASADDLEPAIILTRRCPPAEAYECGIHGNRWHPFSCEECELVLELIRGSV